MSGLRKKLKQAQAIAAGYRAEVKRLESISPRACRMIRPFVIEELEEKRDLMYYWDAKVSVFISRMEAPILKAIAGERRVGRLIELEAHRGELRRGYE